MQRFIAHAASLLGPKRVVTGLNIGLWQNERREWHWSWYAILVRTLTQAHRQTDTQTGKHQRPDTIDSGHAAHASCAGLIYVVTWS